MEGQQARVLPRGRLLVLGAAAALGATGPQQPRGRRRLPCEHGRGGRRLLRPEVHHEEGHDAAPAAPGEHGVRAVEGRLQPGEEQPNASAAEAVLLRRRPEVGWAAVQPPEGVAHPGRSVGVGGRTGAVAQPAAQVSSIV